MLWIVGFWYFSLIVVFLKLPEFGIWRVLDEKTKSNDNHDWSYVVLQTVEHNFEPIKLYIMLQGFVVEVGESHLQRRRVRLVRPTLRMYLTLFDLILHVALQIPEIERDL